MKKSLFLISSLAIMALSLGCNGGGGSSSGSGGGNGGGNSPNVTVAVSPSSVSLDAGESKDFTATVTGDSTSSGVSWSVTGGGTLSKETATSVTLTAPTSSGTVTVTATSKAEATKSAAVKVTVAADPQIGKLVFGNAVDGEPYKAVVSETGGVAPITWSISSGSLPPGLSLNAAGSDIVGTPTTAGTYPFTLEITDSGTPPMTSTVPETIIVRTQLVIGSLTLPPATVGNSYLATFSASGGATPYTWSVSAGSLPAGLALNPATGAISGIPTAAATSGFTIQVTDSSSPAQVATASESFSATAGLKITGSTFPDAVQGTSYSTTPSASGGTAPYTWAVTAGSLPLGLTLNASTGAITGLPTVVGTANFTLTTTDSSTPPQTGTSSSALNVYAPLIIAATIPNAVANQPYSGTLTATGGDAPVTWAITAGSLPAGLTLDPSTGKITGTPTATGTVSFTVQATDSAKPPQIKTQAINFQTNSLLTIVTNTLPNLVTGLLYDTTLSTSGGVGPVTWSATAGLPTGLSLDASTGVLSGTVLAGLTGADITVQATDSSSPPQVASATLSLDITTPGAKSNLLTGDYAMLFNGFDSNGPVAIAGTLHADGIGTLTSGTVDINRSTGVSTNLAVTSGVFTINADNRGTMAITTSAGTLNFRVALDTAGLLGRVIEFDAPGSGVIRGTGFIKQQTDAAFLNSKITGNYAFGFSGSTSTGARSAIIGTFASSGTGAITGGAADINSNGTVSANKAIDNLSTYNIAVNGRGTVKLDVGTTTVNGVVYVVSANELVFLRTDALAAGIDLLSGEILSQTGAPYNSLSFLGIGVAHVEGRASATATSVGAGLVISLGIGTTTGVFDSVDNGSVNASLNLLGTYSVASNGRGSVSIGSNTFTMYMTGQNSAFLMDASGTEVREGRLEGQTGLPINLALIAGNFVTGTLSNTVSTLNYESGVANIASLGNLTGDVDINASNGTLTTASPLSGLLTLGANGQLTLGDGTIYFVISPTRLIAIGAQSGNLDAQITELDQ